MLGTTYLGVWLAFGILCYTLYNAAGMPWPDQGLIGGAALVIAGLYELTPIKRLSEALCRERCALHGPLPFNLMRSALVVGARYGLSCLGCSEGLTCLLTRTVGLAHYALLRGLPRSGMREDLAVIIIRFPFLLAGPPYMALIFGK